MNDLPEHTDKIISVRKEARQMIPELLEKGPLNSKDISSFLQSKFPNLCDNSIICRCGSRKSGGSEWKHNMHRTIADLKFNKKIKYDEKTKEYSLVD